MRKNTKYRKCLALLPIAMAAQASLAATSPAQTPLLKRTDSVRPNVIIMLDDSGSMKDLIDMQVGTQTKNWPRWVAVQRALRKAIEKDKYTDKFRLGYGAINDDKLKRGVRPYAGQSRTQFLNWLGYAIPKTDRHGNQITDDDDEPLFKNKGTYGNSASGPGKGTPLHQAVFVAGEYFRGRPPKTEAGRGMRWYNTSSTYYTYPWPWKKKGYTYKPWDTKSGKDGKDKSKLSCRSANLILLTDGAWSSAAHTGGYGTYDEWGGPFGFFRNRLYKTTPAVSDASETWGKRAGPVFSGTKDGKDVTLGYKPRGDENRELYIPYGDFGKAKPDSSGNYSDTTEEEDKDFYYEKKLSDLTAYYYWHTDLRPDMKNEVVTGGPTFWQNMKTYTINFQVEPKNLTYQDIENYETAYLTGATGDALVDAKPNWTPGPTFDDNDKRALQDDTIQAGFTGGGRGYSPSTPAELEKVFDKILNDAIFGGRGDDAGVAVSGTPVYNATDEGTLEGRTKYLVEYDSLKNAGDLVGYELNAEGDFANTNANGEPTPSWRASERLPAASNRRLYLLDPSGSRHTLRTNTVLDAASVGSGNFEAINPKKGATEDTRYFAKDTAFAQFMLGVGAQKSAAGDLFRPLPKIAASVNSPALFVSYSNNMQYAKFGTEQNARTFSKVSGNEDYKGFFETKYGGNTLVYTPTNSGIIHAFNGTKGLKVGGSTVAEGREVGAYLPNSVMPKLEKFSKRDYSFEYLTDGPLIEQDIYDGTKWRQILFGTGGRGGQFAYALESRLEGDKKKATRMPAQRDFLWEKSNKEQETGNMAYMTNAITAGQLLDGRWVMLVNSGHYPAMKKDAQGNDVKQEVGLYVLNALTGETIDFLPLPANYQADNRGLGGVTAVRDVGRRIVAAYAGDAKGNLWRFDLRSGKMKISYGKPLFTAPDGQAIYAAPAWRRHINGGKLPTGQTWPSKKDACEPEGKGDDAALCGVMVAVGTGIMLDNGDVLDGGKTGYQQALYGIWDPTAVTGDDKKDIEVGGFTTIRPNELLTQSLNDGQSVGSTTNNTLLTSTENEVNYADSSKTLHRGWKLNLDALGTATDGERVIDSPKNAAKTFLFSSVVINDKRGPESCTAQRDFANLLYSLDFLSGAANKAFDSDNDGKPDAYSAMFVPDGGFARGTKLLSKGKTDLDNLLKRYTGPETEDCIACDPCDGVEREDFEGQLHGTSGKQTVSAECWKGGGDGWDGRIKRSWRQILNVPKPE